MVARKRRGGSQLQLVVEIKADVAIGAVSKPEVTTRKGPLSSCLGAVVGPTNQGVLSPRATNPAAEADIAEVPRGGLGKVVTSCAK